MKTRTIMTAVIILAIHLTACSVQVVRGSGNILTEEREVSGFERVSVCCGMTLALSQGQSESMEIQADDNLLPEITTTVEGGELVVQYVDSFLESSYRPSQPVQVIVTARTIHGIGISGGGGVRARDLETNQISVELSGGSRGDFEALVTSGSATFSVAGGGRLQIEEVTADSITLDLGGGSDAMILSLTAQGLNLEVSGGGNALIAGQVNEQNINLSGSSDYDARDLRSQSATIEMSGGGEATLWVHNSLEANLSGGSLVQYFGNPEITEDLSGGSSLEPMGDR